MHSQTRFNGWLAFANVMAVGLIVSVVFAAHGLPVFLNLFVFAVLPASIGLIGLHARFAPDKGAEALPEIRTKPLHVGLVHNPRRQRA